MFRPINFLFHNIIPKILIFVFTFGLPTGITASSYLGWTENWDFTLAGLLLSLFSGFGVAVLIPSEYNLVDNENLDGLPRMCPKCHAKRAYTGGRYKWIDGTELFDKKLHVRINHDKDGIWQDLT